MGKAEGKGEEEKEIKAAFYTIILGNTLSRKETRDRNQPKTC